MPLANARHIRNGLRACQANRIAPPNLCQIEPSPHQVLAISGLFRLHIRVAAGAAGRRNHRHRAAGIRRRRAHFRIDAGWRAQYSVRPCEPVAERLSRLAGGRPLRRDGSARWRRCAFGRGCGRRRRSLRRRRRGRQWGLRMRSAGERQQRSREQQGTFHPHAAKTIFSRGGSRKTSGFAVADQRKMSHRRHRPPLGE
jgi:hypothetical protein